MKITEVRLRQIIRQEILQELNSKDIDDLRNIFLKGIDNKLSKEEKLDIIKPRVDAQGDVVYNNLLNALHMDEELRKELKAKGLDTRRRYDIIRLGIDQIR
jgi:hypothetical protein